MKQVDSYNKVIFTHNENHKRKYTCFTCSNDATVEKVGPIQILYIHSAYVYCSRCILVWYGFIFYCPIVCILLKIHLL